MSDASNDNSSPALSTLDDGDWEDLMERIEDGKCTPFLGAGVNDGILPLGPDIARELAERHDYPFGDSSNLAAVAQFIASTKDGMIPKEQVRRIIRRELREWEKSVALSDFIKAPDQPLGILAELPIPVYITTNYDDLMFRVLKAQGKEPQREFYRWNSFIRAKQKESVFDSPTGREPTRNIPLVFHLHGHDEVDESLVLTEDDYIDFTVNLSKKQDWLPPRIQEALAGSSLLFIGYSLNDWNFRVLFRGLVQSMEGGLRRTSVSVQLPKQEKSQQEYMTRQFGDMKIQIYWGTAEQFAVELRERWDKFRNGS